MDKRKRKWRGGGGGRLFKEGNYFQYFGQRGDYLREAINRGTAIIRGNTLYIYIERDPSDLLGNTLLIKFMGATPGIRVACFSYLNIYEVIFCSFTALA